MIKSVRAVRDIKSNRIFDYELHKRQLKGDTITISDPFRHYIFDEDDRIRVIVLE